MGKAHPALHRTQCVSLDMFPLDRLCSMPDAGWLHQEDSLPTSFFYPCSRNFLPAEAIGKGQGCGWVCSGAGSHGLFSMIVSDWLPEWWHLNIKVQMLNTHSVFQMMNTFAPFCVCNSPGCAKFPVWGVSEAEQNQPGTGGTAVCPEQIKKSIQRMKMHLWCGSELWLWGAFFLEGKKLPDVEGL